MKFLPILFLAAVCTLVLFEAATTMAERGQASGTPIQNAALYPRLLAVLLLILVVAQAFADLRQGVAGGSDARATTPRRLVQMSVVMLALVSYLALLPILGFLLATPVFVLALLLGLGEREPVVLIALSLAVPAGCLLVFQVLLNVNLPRGVFGIALNL